MRDVKSMLRDYFNVMDVPDDVDGLIRFVTEKFGEQCDYYASLDARYDGHKYPDRALVQDCLLYTSCIGIFGIQDIYVISFSSVFFNKLI